MPKTYATLALDGDQWVMSGVAAHVCIRLKQVFPRIAKWQTGDFTFPSDTTHCADLHWFAQRYLMRMSDADRQALNRGRLAFEDDQNRMDAIVRAAYTPTPYAGLRDGQTVRDYQGQAVDLVLLRRSLLLGDDVGLGKTYTAAGLMLAPGTGPVAAVMQTHLQHQWAEKIEAFTTLRVHRIRGTKPYHLPQADVFLFKYSQLLGWIDTFGDEFFTTVVFDEVQELRTGRASGKGVAAKRLSEHARYRLGLSATPIYNYGTELWNIIEVLAPGLLGSHEEFMREWTDGDRTVKNPQALGSFLREQHVFVRRTKRDVGQHTQTPNTIVEHIGCDDRELRSIDNLARTLAIKTTTGTFMERGRAGRDLDLLMRHVTGVAKARGVAQYVRILLEAEMPVLLAGWHRDVYDVWLRELADYAPVMYTGSESPARKNEAKRRFVDGKSNLMIISLRSGAGLDGLQHRCSTVVFGELDWSPRVHEQVIGRVHREGQGEQVTAIYLNTDDGSDPPMVDMLGLKASQSSAITDPNAPLTRRHSDKSRIQALAAQFLRRSRRDAA